MIVKADKIYYLLLLLGVSVFEVSCGPRYVAPSGKSMDLTSDSGVFWIIPGNELLDGGRTMGPQENLIYLLIVCPHLKVVEHGTGSTHGVRVNSYYSFWKSAGGEVSISLDWNKRTDKVIIGKEQFNRKVGNVFVVVRQPTGNIMTRQLSGLGSNADASAALTFIKNQIANDAVIANVRIPARVDQ